MNNYHKYTLIILLALFTLYYTSRVKKLSDYNNTILTSISDYALGVNRKCIEGSINNDGIVLGYSGISVDMENSYANMKGVGFRKDLIEYKKDECLINKEKNLDKYIISGNKQEKKVSLVIDLIDLNYYKNMFLISKSENVKLNYLVDINSFKKTNLKDNILLKTNDNNIKEFKKIINSFYCVKYNNFDVINYCKKYKKSSILISNYFNKNLLLNTKKVLDNGKILFIRENKTNYDELFSAIKYIKSMGYSIVSIDELLS